MLTNDDKYYLIGQKLSSLLNVDQQKRLLRDALGSGKLPPGNNTGPNCICPDIVTDIQTMIRAEFDIGLSQAQRLAIQPPNNVVVIQQPTYFQEVEKPLPGLPAGEWEVQNTYHCPFPYSPDDVNTAVTTDLYGNNISIVTPQPSEIEVIQTPSHSQQLELTSLRFPKPGSEPYLHCAPCRTNHPTRLFSATQRRLPAPIRKCIAREGYVRLCAHRVVTWNLVEACLLSRPNGSEPRQEGRECEDDDIRGDSSTEPGVFIFTCQHASHIRAPEVIVYGSQHNSYSRPEDADDRFGCVVLRWTTTQPPCGNPLDAFIPGVLGSDTSRAHSQDNQSTDHTGQTHPHSSNKNVICPGQLRGSVPVADTRPQTPMNRAPCHHFDQTRTRPVSRCESRLSSRISTDSPSTISSYSPSSYSSWNLGTGSRPGSALTDHDCNCTSATHTTTTTITNELRHSELTINAVDMMSSPALDQPQSTSYHSPSEPRIQRTINNRRTQVYKTTLQTPQPDDTVHMHTQINPSSEWYAAVHPDSYNLDKWAKEGLFGLRWCSEPECMSYLGLTRSQIAGKGSVHRECPHGGGCQ